MVYNFEASASRKKYFDQTADIFRKSRDKSIIVYILDYSSCIEETKLLEIDHLTISTEFTIRLAHETRRSSYFWPEASLSASLRSHFTTG